MKFPKVKIPEMSKRMRIMLICVGILFGCVALYKGFSSIMLHIFMSRNKVVVPVSVTKVDYAAWQPKITAVTSLRAIRGVNVTTELAGMVTTIYFTPGATVQQGDMLVQLNADAEVGQLQSLEAQEALANITYERDKAQYAIHAVSKQTLDADFQNLKNLHGQVAQQAATVAKKAIRAPFTGRLGINNINLGQYLNPGDKIVQLQTLDPIWADFYVPQQILPQLRVGMLVHIHADSFPQKSFDGKITTINPAVETDSRNVQVEATIANPTFELAPGMFAHAEVELGTPKKYLTLPQTAVAFNPYGDIVYVVQPGKDKDGKKVLIANQRFVITGETRGDQITILKGLKGGETVVTSGMLKLKNKSVVSINNSIQLPNNPAPILKNER